MGRKGAFALMKRASESTRLDRERPAYLRLKQELWEQCEERHASALKVRITRKHLTQLRRGADKLVHSGHIGDTLLRNADRR